MAKILVTGGAGFIGSHLCRKLIDSNNQVICLDNIFTGSKQNIAALSKNKNFQFINADITKPLDLKVEQIYNLACPASPLHYQIDPVSTIKTSVLGAINVLDLAEKRGAKVLQASTSEVYGDPTVHPQPEKYWGNVNPIGIRSCYDEGKRCAEALFFDYNRMGRADVRVIRIFNTYGPLMNPKDGRVVSNFIVQALLDQDITIYGDGSQTRSFQYIDDLISGMVKMMQNESFVGPVNLGNPDEFSVKELAEIVLKMVPNTKSKILYKPLPKDDPRQRNPDIRVAKKYLGWQPKIKLEDGLKMTINYFSDLKDTNPELFVA